MTRNRLARANKSQAEHIAGETWNVCCVKRRLLCIERGIHICRTYIYLRRLAACRAHSARFTRFSQGETRVTGFLYIVYILTNKRGINFCLSLNTNNVQYLSNLAAKNTHWRRPYLFHPFIYLHILKNQLPI
ncbi:uncharacterized protein LOC143179089 [Calliopsis andreniformis]|uniref:uncharacterized protein LOC143179089 n=1 Tax=Calliopsis andreniformis TaxID=337506 RepID=UPI003FCC4019